MTRASSRKSVGFDFMDVLFFVFGRISHHMNPSSPFTNYLDLWILRLVISCSLRQPGSMAPDLPMHRRIAHDETRTIRSCACSSTVILQNRLATSCTSLSRFQVIISSVYTFLHRSLPIPSCQIVLQFQSTTSLHQSRPTRVFRHYRPTSPPYLQARK